MVGIELRISNTHTHTVKKKEEKVMDDIDGLLSGKLKNDCVFTG